MTILVWHFVKSVRIRSFSGPYFHAFGLNTERCGVSLCIQSKCGKKWTRKTPNTDRHCTCLAQWSKPVLGSKELLSTAEKMKFSIKDFFSIHDKNRNFLWTQSHLLKKSLIENIFYAEYFSVSKEHFAIKRQIKKKHLLDKSLFKKRPVNSIAIYNTTIKSPINHYFVVYMTIPGSSII